MTKISYFLYPAALLLCLSPFIDTPLALLCGILIAQFVKNPFATHNKKLTHYLLQASVVGLGFGMNLTTAIAAGKQGLIFTIFSIISTLALGLFLGRRFKVDHQTSFLISTGTAVCGGSAIAAVSSISRSNEKQISTALGAVFVLNSVALFLFPWLGRLLHLTQHQFGVWAAIAIHDTSSVVGAASKFGNEALQIATTIKLERALWIIPVSLISIFAFKSKAKKIKIPWFIFLFVAAMLLNTFFPIVHSGSPYIVDIAKAGLKATLFLIGTGLTRDLLKSVGIKPFLQGIVLWIFISSISLTVIMMNLQ